MKQKNAPLKVALVGCGNVVQNNHCPALLKLEENGTLKVIAIIEPVAQAQKKTLELFPAATAVKDFDELTSLEIDFAIVGSPTHLHAEHSIKLLESGISVLCEKPMARTVAEAQSMIDAAEKNRALLAVGLLGRFSPVAFSIKDYLDRGSFGNCKSVTMRRGNRSRGPMRDNWRYQKDLAGGGVLIDVGVHMIDLMISWFGDPVRVLSYQDDRSTTGVESNCVVRLEFPSDVIGELKLSRDFKMPWHCQVSCMNGSMEHDGDGEELKIKYYEADDDDRGTERKVLLIPETGDPKTSRLKTDLFFHQLENFSAAVLGQCGPAVPGTEGIKSLKVVEQCYQLRKPLPKDWLNAEEFQIAQASLAETRKDALNKVVKTLGRIKRRLVKPNRRQQWPQFTDQDFLSLRSTFIESGSWSGGEEVARFTNEFTNYLGVKHGILVNSGTSALEIAVAASGIGPGDEVIVPSYTFYSSASCIAKAGARPVFVDVRLDDACIDPAAVELAITKKTRAIIAVHFGGNPADMDALLKICETHKLILIEDAAHAAGSQWRGKALGSIGTFGCFSFHSSKPLASGEGGFIATNDGALYETAQALADFGILPGRPRYEHEILGSNMRISKFQAAILSIQLKKLDGQILEREKNVNLLAKYLREIGGVTPWTRAEYATKLNHYVYGFYYNKDYFGSLTKSEFAAELRSEGIPCLEGYECPLYEQPVFKRLDETLAQQAPNHENTLTICRTVVGLDQGFLLYESNVKRVARTLLKIQAEARKRGF